MNSKCALVITSIAKADNRVLQTFAKDCPQHDVEFIVIGDKPSPLNFNLEGCNFYGLEAQRNLDFSFCKASSGASLFAQKHRLFASH